MWCVAQLNEPYIERIEDILTVYEKPLTVPKSQSGSTAKFALLGLWSQENCCHAIANMSAGARPTCSAGCNRKRDDTCSK